MTSKPKQIRKKLEDSDDDENGDGKVGVIQSSTVKKKKPGNKKVPNSVLSFGDADDEDEDGTPFQVKKTKQSKTVKKRMMQAPGILDSQEAAPTYAAATTSDYSTESLKSLREKQNFAIPQPTTDVDSETQYDGIELSGDAAESLAELMEVNPKPDSSSMLPPYPPSTHAQASIPPSMAPGKPGFVPLQPLDEIIPTPTRGAPMPDYLPLEPRPGHKTDTRNGPSSHRKRKSDLSSSEAPEDGDNSQTEEDATWEDALARRAGVRPLSPSRPFQSNSTSKNGHMTGTRSLHYGASSRGSDTSSTRPTVASVTATLRRNISVLEESCGHADRQLHHAEASLAVAKEEKAMLSAKVNAGRDQLSFLKVTLP